MALEQLFESVNGQRHTRTDDGQKVITIAHPEHSSGELKMLVTDVVNGKCIHRSGSANESSAYISEKKKYLPPKSYNLRK